MILLYFLTGEIGSPGRTSLQMIENRLVRLGLFTYAFMEFRVIHGQLNAYREVIKFLKPNSAVVAISEERSTKTDLKNFAYR